jgi:hypothetical protein
MRRLEFITLLATTATWPLAVRAQQPAMPVIGVLNSETSESQAERMAAFRQGLKESGFVEGQNVAIEFAWAKGQYDSIARPSRRLGPATCGRDRRNRPSDSTRSQGYNLYDPNRIRERRRSGSGGASRQPQPSERKCYRREPVQCRA